MAKSLIERLGEYRQKATTSLSDQQEIKLVRTLQRLETEVVKEISRLPTRKGVLFNTRLAIELRPKIKQYIEQTYLTTVQSNVADYDKIAGAVVATYGKLPVDEVFKEITEIDLGVINQLKKITFAQFEDLGNEFVGTLSDEIYQSTLVGTPVEKVIENVRGKINGIYQSSNNTEAQELVDFIANNPEQTAEVTTALSRLQTIYGRDRLGNNLRRYATQIVQDSIMGFDGQFAKYRADQIGLDHFTYTGTTIRDSRDFCKRHVGKTYSREQIENIWSSQSWSGKASGDPFVVRGGYNCRHHWQPTDPSWSEEELNNVPDKPIVDTPTTTTTLSTLANRVEAKDIPIQSTRIVQANLLNRITKNASDPRYPKDKIKYKGGYDIGKINLKNIDDKTASYVQAIMFELDELAVKYDVPKLRGVVSNARSKRTIASMGDGVLTINPKLFNKPNSTKTVSTWKFGDDITKKPFTADEYFTEELDKIRTTMYHEFAHQIHQMKYVNNNPDYGVRFIPLVEKKLTQVVARQSATKYGSTNNKEWFAENFSLYEMGRKDIVDPRFIQFIESEM
jgi:hypothetical protein